MNRALTVLAIASAGAVVVAGCPEVRSHIYSAELYDSDADCLFPGVVLDVVPGVPDDASTTCDAICITDLDGQVYLSGQCPPLPIEFNLDSGGIPECKQAYEALSRCRQCPIEGGSVTVTCDAGPADAGTDAPVDAAKDGPVDAPSESAKDAPSDAPKDTQSDTPEHE
jgi:hypothetical protein